MKKLFKPFVSEQAITNVIEVLRSDMLAEGPQVKEFERGFGEKFLVDNVVAVNSGTSALELAYELAGITTGDEVITPILTCTATNLPLLHKGAKIVFADITDDLNIDIEDVKRKITEKTRAIVFVHFGGNGRGLKELVELGRERGIYIIEDAAQAVGGDVLAISDFTCISLQAIKTLTSGDGGFLITRSREHYEKAKRLRWFGIDRDAKQGGENPDVTEAGYKYHMNDISAAIGRGNLSVIDELISHRKRIGKIYESYGLFAHIWLAGGLTDNYEGLKKALNEAGYEMGQHHYRNDKYTVFGAFSIGDGELIPGTHRDYRWACPNMDRLEDKYFFVPLHHDITEEDAHRVGEICKSYI